jgi:hypothetical protein
MGSTAPRAYEWDFLEPGTQARRGLDTEQVKRPLSPTPHQPLDKLQTSQAEGDVLGKAAQPLLLGRNGSTGAGC